MGRQPRVNDNILVVRPYNLVSRHGDSINTYDVRSGARCGVVTGVEFNGFVWYRCRDGTQHRIHRARAIFCAPGTDTSLVRGQNRAFRGWLHRRS